VLQDLTFDNCFKGRLVAPYRNRSIDQAFRPVPIDRITWLRPYRDDRPINRLSQAVAEPSKEHVNRRGRPRLRNAVLQQLDLRTGVPTAKEFSLIEALKSVFVAPVEGALKA